MLTQIPTSQSNNKVRLGRPLGLNEKELDEASTVSDGDIKYVAEQWRLLVPARFALLLNAVGFIKGPKRGMIG